MVPGHTGWLYKKSDSTFKLWSKYWFKCEGSTLLYYKSEDATEPHGTFNLIVAQVKDAPDAKHCFVVLGPYLPPRGIVLCATSEEEKEQWVEALKGAAEGAVVQDNKYVVSLDAEQATKAGAQAPKAAAASLVKKITRAVTRKKADVDESESTGPAVPSDCIWHQPAFLDLFANHCIPAGDRGTSQVPAVRRLCAALRLVEGAFAKVAEDAAHEAEEPDAVAQACTTVAAAMGRCMDLCGKLAESAQSNERLVALLEEVVETVNHQMQAGDLLLLPGGWGDGTPAGGHALLYVLQRSADITGTFRLAVCNTGKGVEYHPMSAFAEPPGVAVRYQLALRLDDIPYSRVRDSSFWFAAFWMLRNTQKGAAELLYSRLLPHLNSR
eukprot:EG_transcript_15914